MASRHVQGIGGIFFRSKDPEGTAKWYEQHFGITPPGQGMPWRTSEGVVVFGPFDDDTDYFGGPQDFMVNFRIDDLDAFCQELAEAGIEEVKARETMEGIGRFTWIEDPEGRRIELWEPAPEAR